MDTIWQDIRQGARVMARNPWFALIAVLVLALGIGPSTAIFSVVNTLLLTPPPYADPDTIVRISQIRPGFQGPQRSGSISTDDFQQWRLTTQQFEQMALFAPNTITLTGQEEPVRLNGASVSPSLFALLRVQPLLGRVFAPDNEKAGNDRVVLLAQSCWERRFGGNRSVLGRSIKLEGNDYMVVGVMPAGFDFPARGTEYWIPFTLNPPQRGGKEVRIQVVPALGRLKAGATIAQAVAEGNNILKASAQNDPRLQAAGLAPSLQLTTLQEQTVGPVRPALIALLGAVGFVLLIACANIAGLLLARATDRQKEIAIRASLGAGRGRLTRQMLIESAMLSLIGGGLGLLLGYWGVALLPRLGPGNIPRVDEIQIDLKVLGFTLAVSLLTGLLFGLAPALKCARQDLVQALKEGGITAKTGFRLFRHNRLRSLLAILEYALALVLLIGAGLLMNSFLRLINQNPGYDPRDVLTMQISLPRARYAQPDAQIAFYERLLEGIRGTQGVLSAGMANLMPMSQARMQLSFDIEGRAQSTNPADSAIAGVRLISPGFLQALRIPVLQGRDFNDQDRQNSDPVVLVNQAFVQRYLSNQNPLGKSMDMGRTCRIVGVTGNFRPQGLDSEPQPEAFLCYKQFGQMLMMGGPLTAPNLVVRTEGKPLSLVPVIRTEVTGLDPQLPVFNVSTMEQRVSDSVAQPRFFAVVLSIFAVMALVLAIVGIYGLLSYHVSQSTREIGIRMALGADRARVFRLVLGQGAALAGIGIVLGIGGAWATSRFLESFLFSVKPVDALTYLGITVLMACIGILASYVPARRATTVDPIVALRQE